VVVYNCNTAFESQLLPFFEMHVVVSGTLVEISNNL